MAQHIINKTDLNLYVSKSQKEEYKERFKIRTDTNQEVVYNGVSFDKFENIKHKALREEFQIAKETIILGSVGNFGAVRDQLTICRFLNILNQKIANFAFIFAGSKNEKEPCLFDECVEYCKKNGLANKVFFPGSRNDIPNILSQPQSKTSAD